MNDAESSASFIAALARFSQSLAESGTAIYEIAYDLLAFGSWTMELGTRHHRSLLRWDGKESRMSLSQWDVADSRSPQERKLVVEERIAGRSTHEQLFGAAEKFLSANARS
jgi:hypothetical protein